MGGGHGPPGAEPRRCGSVAVKHHNSVLRICLAPTASGLALPLRLCRHTHFSYISLPLQQLEGAKIETEVPPGMAGAVPRKGGHHVITITVHSSFAFSW